MSRAWRSSAEEAGDVESVVETAISKSRVAESRVLIWHTGWGISPPGVEPPLAERGFTLAEELEVFAFELWDDSEPRSPTLGETEAFAEPVCSVEGLREAVEWTRRYSESRSLPRKN